jgi:hypothetical protein
MTSEVKFDALPPLQVIRIGACGEFVHEALVPGVDAVAQEIFDGFKKTVFASTFALGQIEGEVRQQILGAVRLNQDVLVFPSRPSAFVCSGVVCGTDIGYDKSFYSIEKLIGLISPVEGNFHRCIDGRAFDSRAIEEKR